MLSHSEMDLAVLSTASTLVTLSGKQFSICAALIPVSMKDNGAGVLLVSRHGG